MMGIGCLLYNAYVEEIGIFFKNKVLFMCTERSECSACYKNRREITESTAYTVPKQSATLDRWRKFWTMFGKVLVYVIVSESKGWRGGMHTTPAHSRFLAGVERALVEEGVDRVGPSHLLMMEDRLGMLGSWRSNVLSKVVHLLRLVYSID